jgi:hypothetical protein
MLSSEVRQAVTAAVGTTGTRVVAVWRPHPGSAVAGRVAVGAPPPPRTDVHAARVDVPVRGGHYDGRSRYETLAYAIAERTVDLLFPSDSTRLALGLDYPTNALARHRYRRAASLLGVDINHPPAPERVGELNRRLRDTLAATVEQTLRERYATADTADSVAQPGRVRIVVQRWSP